MKKFFYDNKSGVYVYSNKTLIEELGIEQEEMKDLRTIFNREEKLRRKNEKRKKDRRNENGLNSREQAKCNNIIAVGTLSEKGFKNKDIVIELGLTKGTVSKYLKEYLSNKEYYYSLIKVEEIEVNTMLDRVTDTELKLLVI